MLKIASDYVSLWVIIIDFVLKKDKNYYSQVFLEECKYIDKEKKMTRYITNDLEISFVQVNLMKNKLKLSIMMGSF